MTYTIKLPQFEGPFDLLLFFIERDELDIYNIPISTITDDFLDYIRQMEALNIDIASEFILVASTLMRIKAKLLLPRKELDEAGNEIDPRQELVERLLEYKRYKSVLEDLQALESARGKKNERGNVSQELKSMGNLALADAELESMTLFKLLKAFDSVMERFEYRSKKVIHKVVRYNYTIGGTKKDLIWMVNEKGRSEFKAVFDTCENRMHAIFTFLAMLELLALQMLCITIGEGANNFWLEPGTVEEDLNSNETANSEKE